MANRFGVQPKRKTRSLAQRIFDKLKGEIAEGKWFEKLPGENYTFEDLMNKYHEGIFCGK
jgi:DNA-binding FadR family transcriptional regulator